MTDHALQGKLFVVSLPALKNVIHSFLKDTSGDSLKPIFLIINKSH